MTAQEIFDLVVNHLRTQKSKSTRVVKYWARDEVEAALRGSDGKKCPLGFLLTDEEYSIDMEGTVLSSLLPLVKTPQSVKDRLAEHAQLIDDLIFTHDFFDENSEWEEQFALVAKKHKLVYLALPLEEEKVG